MKPNLFEPFYFFLSREVTRPTLEFCIRSFGGTVGWDPVLGSGSPLVESDARITHHIVDRPPPPEPVTYPGKRSLVQPQWVIDCINAKRLLSVGPYGPGIILPPHLSPFVSEADAQMEGIYVPTDNLVTVQDQDSEDELESEEEGQAVEEEEEFMGIEILDDDPPSSAGTEAEEETTLPTDAPAFNLAVKNPFNESLKHEAELEAETLGIPFSQFEENLTKAIKVKASERKASRGRKGSQLALEPDNSILLTNKKRNQFNKLAKAKAEKVKEVSPALCTDRLFHLIPLQRDRLLAKRKAIAKSQ